MKKTREQPLTRLVDANPVFLEALGNRTGVGLHCDCPYHEECIIDVLFTNPIDGGAAVREEVTWERTGDTFETLTLSPSIRVLGGPEGCQWHGFIRSGMFEHCGDAK